MFTMSGEDVWQACSSIDPALPNRVRKRGVMLTGGVLEKRLSSGAIQAAQFNPVSHSAAGIKWADMQNELAASVRRADKSDGDSWCVCDAAVADYRESGDGVECILADGRTMQAKVLVGADGAFSRVRAALGRQRSPLGRVPLLGRWLARLSDRPGKFPQTNWNAMESALAMVLTLRERCLCKRPPW